MTTPDMEEDEPVNPQKRVVMEAFAALAPELRSEIIDDLLETYCSMCAEKLDEEGECPEGCDPEDLLDEGGDDTGADDDDEEEEEESDS